LHTPIILLHAGPYQVGWIVDEALSVFQLMRSQIRPSSDAALRHAQEANLIVSELVHAERVWLLLDVQRLLTEVVPLVSRAVSMAQQQGTQARRVRDANGAGA
jgi:chemotaxis signal transduction protein